MNECKEFYCQLNYEHVFYPSLTSPNGNIANNGCGVCCASMVIESLTETKFPIEESARFAKNSGAREGFGTDMSILAPALAKQFQLKVEKTIDPQRVLEFLQSGKGLVIANPAGDREGWIGVFADSRHYVVVASASGSEIEVWDPMYRPGRYDVPKRAGKVRMDGFKAYAQFEIIVNDCNGRPYYLFSK
ncbi:MAG: hypothetical protein IJC38_00020 [Erysipelotrichaceae bacterium]|nr:hypothetical protein [Erysipelotrichaceae bacterium]